MRADDFYYAGHYLSDYGFIIVWFDDSSKGFSEETAGSTLVFNQVSQDFGLNQILTSVNYDEPFETTFGICKPDGSVVTVDEYSELMRWLNRKEYYEFYLVDDDWSQVIFDGSFNVQKELHKGAVIGFQLTFKASSSCGHMQAQTVKIELEANKARTITNLSDEVGFLYPDAFKITCGAAGTLEFTNSAESRTTVITNCTAGEAITFKGKSRLISSSVTSGTRVTYPLLNSFNYIFPRLYRGYDSSQNELKANMDCTIEFTYTPVRKVVI